MIPERAADAVWWPWSRLLGHEVPDLVGRWPPRDGVIVRVLYALSDWADHPRSVVIPNRRGPVQTIGHTSHLAGRLEVATLDGHRSVVLLVPPEADQATAARVVRDHGCVINDLAWLGRRRLVTLDESRVLRSMRHANTRRSDAGPSSG